MGGRGKGGKKMCWDVSETALDADSLIFIVSCMGSSFRSIGKLIKTYLSEQLTF